MGYLSFNEVMETALPTEDIEVPSLGGTVQIRAVTGAEWERAKRMSTNRKTKDLNEMRFAAMLVVAACVEPSFPPASEDRLMRELSAGVITRIAAAIGVLSGFEDDEGQDEDDDQGEA